jgi:hypothetical protein
LAAYGERVELTSRSAIRGVAPQRVVDVVQGCLGTADDEARTQVLVAPELGGWTTLTWPAYFAPRDLDVCRVLSRELRAVVSTVTTTTDEGWSHHLFGCGTELDRFHSYPAGLAWDDGDVHALGQEWRGDFELVARVVGVDACAVRRHFCQATPAARDHPGRDRDGYLGLWAALGIRVPDASYAAVPVAPVWSAVTAG